MAEIVPLPDADRLHPARDPEPLWRDALGTLLRRIRLARGERLADTAGRAGVSPQYLSEVERGLKEPSSEMIAAMAGALGVTLIELTATIALELRSAPVAAPIGAPPSLARNATSRGALVLAA